MGINSNSSKNFKKMDSGKCSLSKLLIVSFAFTYQMMSATEQPDCDCGYPRRLPRIVNGSEVSLHRFPWTVAVALRSGRFYMLRCGGAIISATYVLTAAHCAENLSYLYGLIRLSLAVDVGDHDLTTTADATNRFIAVSEAIQHPAFVRKTLENDIGLLRLETPIVFRYNVRPICLPSKELHLAAGHKVTVVGWGADSKGGFLGDVLKGITVPVISRKLCQQLYYERRVKISSNDLCAGDLGGGKDACQGDSGGPCTVECDSMNFLAGIVSYGIGCATQQLPGVYTDVSRYTSWIRNNTEDAPACYPKCDITTPN